MPELPPTSYDEVPYEGCAVEVTHPDYLAAVAALLGLRPAPPDHCRVLELGCSDGGNLIAMALTLPDSRFLGVDLSPRQVAAGHAVVRRLGLANVELQALSILDVDDAFGEFDYILCHGVYSWVPQAIRDKILSICKHNLAPQGVAYVSYNTYPGWHLWAPLRDLAQFHGGHVPETAERTHKVRAFLDLMARSFTNSNEAYHAVLRGQVEDLRKYRDTYVFHEYLEDVNEPVYFRQFMEQAAAHGLQYLEEVCPSPLPVGIAAEIVHAVDGLATDLLDREQYLDFLSGRSFRRTLLCHTDVPVSRPYSAQALMGLCLSALAQPAKDKPDVESQAVEEFRTDDGKNATTNDPLLKTALARLAEASPQAVPFAELWAHVSTRLREAPEPARLRLGDGPLGLAEGLLRCYRGRLLDVHLQGRRFTVKPGERPVASPLALLEAASGPMVTNLCHRPIELGEFPRALLRLLDGTRDREALLANLTELVGQGTLVIRADGKPLQEPAQVRRVLEMLLPRWLRSLAAMALLVG